MNTIYRIVWNAATGKWIVASELAKGRKKKSARVAMASLALALVSATGIAAAQTATNPAGTIVGGAGGANSIAIGAGSTTSCGVPAAGAILNPNFVDGTCIQGSAFGNAAVANSGGTAMGDHAVTSGFYGVALGAYSSAATHATAVGPSAMATGSDSFAGGVNASASGGSSIAIGNRSSATSAQATALGAGAQATGGAAPTALGNTAKALQAYATAVGNNTSALTNSSVALGNNATAGLVDSDGNPVGANQVALGMNTQALADRSVALGAGATVDAAATYGMAMGRSASVTAAGVNSVALGQASVADRANTVSVGAAGSERQVVNVAAGMQDTDAVNLSQLKGTAESIADVIGGGSTVGSDGTISAPSYSVGGTTVHNVGDAISNIDGRVTKSAGDITNLQATVADAVMYDSAAHDSVTLGGTSASAPVALKNIANGALTDTSTEAVNGSQLFATNERVTKSEGDIVTIGDRVTSAETHITNIDGRVTTNEGDIVDIRNQLGSGSIGLVQQDATSRDITVAAGTDGDRVNFAGTDGARKLAGVAEGELSATSAEAVNGSQLFATNERVTKNEGDIVTIGDRVTSAETNITNLDGRVTKNEGDIIDLGDRINNGSVGLVQQAGASAAVTVAAATGGTIVDITGTDGTRQLKGVSKGEDATDAVNVAQLRDELASVSAGDTRYFKANGANDGTDDAMATGDNAVAIGANARTGGEGAVALGSGAEAKFAGSVAVGEGAAATYANAVAIGAQSSAASSTAVALGTSAKARNSNDTAVGAGAQANLNSTALGQGTTAVNGSTAVGQGATALAANSVALGKGSYANRANSVSVGSAGNERQIVNVADGTQDTDAVNVRQLKSAGLVGDDGSLLDAVVYDAGSNRSAITLGGVAGTTITNVMAGLVAPGSMDAINGSQLWGVQDQINKLGDRVTTIENGTVAPGPTPVNPINPGSENPHFASSGDAAKPATATGSSSVAAGEGAVASGSNSTAIGAGSSATGNNSVAIGAGSVADGDNTVSVGSVGNERRVTNVAAGTQRTDAANVGQLQDAMSNLHDWTQGQVNGLSKKIDNVQRQANRGIAASAALVNNMPYLPGKVTLNAGVAAYRGQSALGVGVSRWNDSGRFNVNAGISAAQGDAPIFRVGVGVVLGD